MKRTNVEIASMVESKGYNFTEALESIDAGRTPEDEKKEITQEEINEMVEAICSSFEIDAEESKMDIEERMCRYPEYFTKQGKYIWENGLEGQVKDIMEKIPCSREMAIEYVYLMNRAFNGID